MEHWITGISTHCAVSENATIHWLTLVCACGQVFTESHPSTSYRSAATSLSKKAVSHVLQENRLDAPTQAVPRITDV